MQKQTPITPKTGKIWFIGQCADPISGQTVFNEKMRQALANCGDLHLRPIGGTSREKLLKGLWTPLVLLVGLRKGDQVYTSPPGQMGLWIFLLTVLALRLRGQDFYAHHHSYRAIAAGPMTSHRILAWLAGPRITHVFLGDQMRDDYAGLYGNAKTPPAIALPNAGFFPPLDHTPPADRHGPMIVGHMSVMTEQKGVLHLLDMWRAAQPAGAKLRLAGPIPDPNLRQSVEQAVAQTPDQIEWVGPVSGAQKQAFLDALDLFVLPTKLIDEADPLVIQEAYRAGANVLAAPRGCIRARLRDETWLLSMDAARDGAVLIERLHHISQDRAAQSVAAREHARAMQTRAAARAVAFFQRFGLSQNAAQKVLGDMADL